MARPHGTNVLYEPRALWQQVRVRPDSDEPTIVPFERNAFYNGTRYPFVVQYILISPLGYTLQRYETDPPLTQISYRNAMAAILACKLRITAPGRKHFSRRVVPSSGYRPRPTALARPDSDFAGTLFGLSRWDFEFPDGEGMVMPRLGQIEFNVSGYTFPNVGLATPSFNPNDQKVIAHAAFYERQDSFWGGYARYSGPLPILPKVPLAGQPADVYPAAPPPTFQDGYGFGAPPANSGPQGNLTFDKFGTWNHKRWMIEESNVGTDSNRFCGFGVLLDQIALDTYMQGATSPGVVGNPLAPLCQRVAIQGKMLAGGSGDDWFFPNAIPLSLACPTINEAAIVHRFDDPISLDPNAGLRVELEVPPALILDDVTYPGIYNIGVSIVGYAPIEGLTNG